MTHQLAVVTDADFPSLDREETILAGAKIQLQPPPGPEVSDLTAAVARADALLVQQRPITAAVLAEASRLKVIACYGVGYDSVDVAAATERRIYVCNVPEYCTDEVAFHALSMVLALSRKLVVADRLVKTGRWNDFRALKPMHTMVGRRLGIVGFGKIGQSVARMAKGLRIEVAAYDPLVPGARFAELEVERLALDELLASSDYVSLHTPLNLATEQLICGQRLAIMRSGAFLVNCARGQLVDEISLVEALESGHLAGAALDVFWDEPIRPDNPLTTMDQVILSPHIAYYSEQSIKRVQVETAEEVVRVLSGRQPRNWVNPWPIRTD